MLKLAPFQGLRPAPKHVAEVACVPYDVLDVHESIRLAEGKPRSLLRVDRAELELPLDTDPYSDAVYARAAMNFARMQADGSLIRETEPCIFLYEQVMGAHRQTGVALVCHVDDYENNVIKKHEKTRPDKENDRTRLVGTLSANTGPVFLTYREQSEIDEMIAAYQDAHAPLYDFTAPDGISHRVWRMAGDASESLLTALRKVECSYVADGHHRTAAAARVGRERRERNPEHTGNEQYNWFLCVLFPGNQLQILPYNRVVKGLNGKTPEAFLMAVSEAFKVTPGSGPIPERSGQIQMFLGGNWYQLEWLPEMETDPISRLDVSGLQDRLLGPILGIADPRTDKRIDFIGGIRGTGELEARVNEGRADVAFSMFPTTVQQLMDIADDGAIMPPKSTWFEPKLRSGLFIHTFER